MQCLYMYTRWQTCSNIETKADWQVVQAALTEGHINAFHCIAFKLLFICFSLHIMILPLLSQKIILGPLPLNMPNIYLQKWLSFIFNSV